MPILFHISKPQYLNYSEVLILSISLLEEKAE